MGSYDDDLLQPVLTEEHDATGFDEPYRPTSLVMLAFFGGPLAAGYMIAQNHRRLGQGERAGRTLLVFFVLAVALVAARTYAAVATDWDAERIRRVSRPIHHAISVGVALLAVRSQRVRFHVYTARGGEPKSLWVPGLLAALGALLVQWLLGAAALAVAAVLGAELPT